MVLNKKVEAFDIINYILLTLVSMIMLYPFVNVLAVSLSSYNAYIINPMRIIPQEFNFDAYRTLFSQTRLWTSYLNTVIVTACTVFFSLMLYILTAYPLSKKGLKGRALIMKLVIFTMLFNGGLIPNYYLIVQLKLLDKLAALVVTSLFSAFNMILVKNYFESLPEALEESAKMDGATELCILFRIVVPLSAPILATIGLFKAVSSWNSFMNAVIYIRSTSKWTLMLYLREILLGARMQEMSASGNSAELVTTVHTETLQFATIIVVMLPIICTYPFVQKYFVKGIMVGSVKG